MAEPQQPQGPEGTVTVFVKRRKGRDTDTVRIIHVPAQNYEQAKGIVEGLVNSGKLKDMDKWTKTRDDEWDECEYSDTVPVFHWDDVVH